MIQNINNMAPNEIKEHLIRLITTAYFGDSFDFRYIQFYIVFNSERVSRQFGQYNMLNHEIEICNLSPNTIDNWKTLIHEIAHHIDWCRRRISDHSEFFYKVYKNLLFTAMDLGWFSPEYLITATKRSADYYMLEKITSEYKQRFL